MKKSDKNICKVYKITPNALLPKKGSKDAAAYDVYTDRKTTIESSLNVQGSTLVHTGLRFEIPKGYVLKCALRSGIAARTNIRMAHGVGIIDSDYTGELLLPVYNAGRGYIKLEAGVRIAQVWLEKLVDVPLTDEQGNEITSDAERHGGFGSTGEK